VAKTTITHSELETAALGRELGETLSAGDVVLLVGDLGAGKTAFVRGLAEGLGVHRDEVSSPTFTLVQEYRGGRLPLFHVDLYRLDDPRELDDLGLDEIADDGVLAIEWAEKLTGNARLKPSALDVARADREAPEGSRYTTVRMTQGEGDVRTIEITNSPTPQLTNYSDR
jgi:tRNA threonylcarbamoyladenosine biosynthesis protein TsaE